MYSALRELLFTLNPEISHDLSLRFLDAMECLKILPFLIKEDSVGKIQEETVKLLGLTFPNPVGLSAGLDKNGDYFNALGQLGFGFIEIGTVTSKSQIGNPKPRIFRLPQHEAIINRMGFNNKGVDYLLEQVKKRRCTAVLGISIGKNKLTAEKDALFDYTMAMEKVYAYADYIAVNISSPNTLGLRNLQFGDSLNRLLDGLAVKQYQLEEMYRRRVPVLIKISPDINDIEIEFISKMFLKHSVDGIIATNTTLDKSSIAGSTYAEETGGLSGAPLMRQSTRIIKQLRQHLGDNMPIIGVGGIQQGSDALEKWMAGANLVQIYSGFIYHGPALIRDTRQAIHQHRALLSRVS